MFIDSQNTEGKSVLLIGHSGVGKTMLMHGLSMQTQDQVFWLSKEAIKNMKFDLSEIFTSVFTMA